MNIWCILRFAKNCTRENKDTTFDHKIAKFDTRENFRLYGKLFTQYYWSWWQIGTIFVKNMQPIFTKIDT